MWLEVAKIVPASTWDRTEVRKSRREMSSRVGAGGSWYLLEEDMGEK
jgi:hypothetical protein